MTEPQRGGIFQDKGADHGPKRASLPRQLPQVDDLRRHPDLAPAMEPLPRLLAAAGGRRVLAAAPRTINAEPPEALAPRLDETARLQDLGEALLAAAQLRLRCPLALPDRNWEPDGKKSRAGATRHVMGRSAHPT